VAVLIGFFCGLTAGANHFVGRSDWAQIWHGARALMDGVSPYMAVGPGRAFPWEFPLLYPLPAIMVGVPFAIAPIGLATGLFVGCSSALLAFLLTRHSWNRLVLVLCAPFPFAVMSAQWSTLLTAAALVPWLGFLFVVKPTVGAALWLYRPSRAATIGGVLLLLVSIAVQPSWPREWMTALSSTGHMVVPLVHAGGPILLLALLRWRRPEARLLLTLACVPQTAFFYEALPLILVPATLPESVSLVALSYAALTWWNRLRPFATVAAGSLASVQISVPLLYLPCLIMILCRPNQGEMPACIERFAKCVRARQFPSEMPQQ